MNGICHDTHMEDGDVQLSTLAQQPESQNVSVFLLCAVVDALIFFHSPLSNPQHHFQPLPPQVLSGLLQIWHRQDPADFECMYSLDFKVEYEYCPHSLLASDGLTVAIVPQSSSFN